MDSKSNTMEQELFTFLSKYMELTEAEKQVLTELALFKEFKKGTVLLKEGERSGMSYFVMKGCLRSYFIINGDEKTTEFYTELAPITPLCSTYGTPSEYYIDCIEDSIVLAGSTDMEQEVFEKFPRFESLCRIFSEEVRAEDLSSFHAYRNSSPTERYFNLVKERPGLVQRVPQYQIASYLGIKPESLSRIRKREATRGAITQQTVEQLS